MQEIIFYGRGGQGAVTAVELAAQAAIADGKFAQGFPNFGPERRGAPVMAFLRVSNTPIFSREKISVPDCVVVMDSTLLGLMDTCKNLKRGGTVIINCPEEKDDEINSLYSQYRLVRVDATKIAMEALGVPITNTAILGALVKATGIVKLDALQHPLEKRFGNKASKNFNAMKQAHQKATIDQRHIASKENWRSNKDKIKPADKELIAETLPSWKDVVIGCDIITPGNSAEFNTGNWRTTGRPYTDIDKCVKCGICWIMCPDMAFSGNEEEYYDWNSHYCKGCGICAQECPAGAIEMRRE